MLERQQKRLAVGLRAMFWEWKKAQAQSLSKPRGNDDLLAIKAEEEDHDTPSIHDILTALSCNSPPFTEENDGNDGPGGHEGDHDPSSKIRILARRLEKSSSDSSIGASISDQRTSECPWTPNQIAPNWTDLSEVSQWTAPGMMFNAFDWTGSLPAPIYDLSMEPDTSLMGQTPQLIPTERFAPQDMTS